ncbi:MAG: hypothetical protein ACRD4K_00250, partial [Candidatus Acidiferrales bacterium]
MEPDSLTQTSGTRDDGRSIAADSAFTDLSEAEKALQELANVFLQQQSLIASAHFDSAGNEESNQTSEAPLINLEAKYRALVEQIPAVVFMAYLDKGIGEAYVSPQIETALGFSQSEWLEDPVR